MPRLLIGRITILVLALARCLLLSAHLSHVIKRRALPAGVNALRTLAR
jgi:hypothetical protein